MSMVRTRRHIYSPRDIHSAPNITRRQSTLDVSRKLTLSNSNVHKRKGSSPSLSTLVRRKQALLNELNESHGDATELITEEDSVFLCQTPTMKLVSPKTSPAAKMSTTPHIKNGRKKRKGSRWLQRSSTKRLKKANCTSTPLNPNTGPASSTPLVNQSLNISTVFREEGPSDSSVYDSIYHEQSTIKVVDQNKSPVKPSTTQGDSVILINETIEVIEVTDDEDTNATRIAATTAVQAVAPIESEVIVLDLSDSETTIKNIPVPEVPSVIVIDDNDSDFEMNVQNKTTQEQPTPNLVSESTSTSSPVVPTAPAPTVITNVQLQQMNLSFGVQGSAELMSDFIQRVKNLEDQFIKHSLQPTNSPIVYNPSNNRCGNNIYNPTVRLQQGLRLIVIDGSNVAMGHTNGKFFSCRGLQICIDYFAKRGHEVKAFVPQFRRQYNQSSSPQMLEQMANAGFVIFTPSRRVHGRLIIPYDDRYIVQCAAEHGGVIVSRDNFRDIINENPAWRETIERRLLMWTWCGDMLMFPDDPCGRGGPSLDTFLRYT